MAGYQFHNVWQEKPSALMEEIIDFWLTSKALPERSQAEQRVEQVAFLARDDQDRIVAVNTVYPQYNQRLENHFYYYRVFVQEAHRRNRLAEELTALAYDFFNRRHAEGKTPRVKGLFAVVESPILKRNPLAVLGGFVYIGRDRKGNPLRVNFFEGARL